MSYIYSGYIIAFGVLGGYTGLLLRRRSKLERLAAKSRREEASE